MSLNCLFDEKKSRRTFHRRKDCIEKFCEEIISHEETEMTPLTDKQLNFMKNKKHTTYAKKSFVMIKIRKANMI